VKKIGFIDYFLDEWHANNYPEWIRQNAEQTGRDIEVAYAWGEIDKPDGLSTDAWCEHYNVKKLSSIEEIVEKSDYIIVLSPDNPEHHERLSRIPLMSGKPVYIDKTFSPDYASGARMFELAERYNTPMFSSSALRFAKEFSDYPNNEVNRDTIEFVATTGGGNFKNYIVHQLEMVVSLMGPGASRVKSLSTNNGKMLVIEYPDGRRASTFLTPATPFQAAIQLKDGTAKFIGQCSDIFPRLTDAMMNFFATGKPAVPKEETLEIMALIEAGHKALAIYDTWIKV